MQLQRAALPPVILDAIVQATGSSVYLKICWRRHLYLVTNDLFAEGVCPYCSVGVGHTILMPKDAVDQFIQESTYWETYQGPKDLSIRTVQKVYNWALL